MALPDPLPIAVRAGLDADVRVPGSKSLSNRALLIAGLADGTSFLEGVLDCDDTRVMAHALTSLGARVTAEDAGWRVEGVAGRPSVPAHALDVRASGTAARFLTAASVLAPGSVRLDGTARMRQRPIVSLTRALEALGAHVAIEGHDGCPPVRTEPAMLRGGRIEVDASLSSQYVSALLLIAPYALGDTTLALRGGTLVSRPYVDLTLDAMAAFGAEARWLDAATLHVTAGRGYAGRSYAIEPDASTAAYFFAAAAILGGRVRVLGLPGGSRQADMGFVDALERMGCGVHRDAQGVEVRGPRPPARLQAIDIDMNAMPDAVLAMAVTALFAEGTTRIHNVANLRIKETDRLAALERELRKLGADARADAESLTLTPGAALHGAEIDTYDDHRMAMAFALAGFRIPGVSIREPGCVSKSWPGYFAAWAAL